MFLYFFGLFFSKFHDNYVSFQIPFISIKIVFQLCRLLNFLKTIYNLGVESDWRVNISRLYLFIKFSKLLSKFHKNGVECRPMIAGNITLQPFYKRVYKKIILKNCEFVHRNGFYFGIHPEMTNNQVKILRNLFLWDS